MGRWRSVLLRCMPSVHCVMWRQPSISRVCLPPHACVVGEPCKAPRSTVPRACLADLYSCFRVYEGVGSVHGQGSLNSDGDKHCSQGPIRGTGLHNRQGEMTLCTHMTCICLHTPCSTQRARCVRLQVCILRISSLRSLMEGGRAACLHCTYTTAT